jgi:hypothetical protein
VIPRIPRYPVFFGLVLSTNRKDYELFSGVHILGYANMLIFHFSRQAKNAGKVRVLFF